MEAVMVVRRAQLHSNDGRHWIGLTLISGLALFGCGEGQPEPAALPEIESEEELLSMAPLQGPALDTVNSIGPDAFGAVEYGPEGSVTALVSYAGPTQVGGMTLPSSAGAPNVRNAAVVRFGTDGRVEWARALEAAPTLSGNSGITLHALAVDTLGSAFVSGSLAQSLKLGGVALTPGEFLAKFSSSGDVLWTRNTRPEPGSSFQFKAFADTPEGDVVAAGTFQRAAGERPQLILVRYRGDNGLPVWTRIYEGSDRLRDSVDAVDVVVNPRGKIYLAGNVQGRIALGGQSLEGPANTGASFLAAFNPKGETTWARVISPFAAATGVDVKDGHLAVAFTSSAGENGDARGAYVASYDLSGQRRWARRVGPSGRPHDVAFGPFRELVVVGAEEFSVGASSDGPGDPLAVGRLLQITTMDRVAGNTLSVYTAEPVFGENGLPVNVDVNLSGASVAVSATGEVAAGGSYIGPIEFGVGPRVSNDFSVDGFLLRLSR